jgi:hypothetical protein
MRVGQWVALKREPRLDQNTHGSAIFIIIIIHTIVDVGLESMRSRPSTRRETASQLLHRLIFKALKDCSKYSKVNIVIALRPQ